MDTLEAIESRRSIRRFRPDLPVEREKVGIILDAGMHAPNSGNVQDWRFIFVREKGTRAKIAEACLQQYWMSDATVHIVVCSVPDKISQLYGERGADIYAIQNSAAAIENMLLAAHSLGLGSCWVGAFEEGMLRRLLSIPDSAKVHAVIPIGYPDESPKKPMRHRIEDVTFLESWGSKFENIQLVLGNYRVILNKIVESGRVSVESLKDRVKKLQKQVKEAIKK